MLFRSLLGTNCALIDTDGDTFRESLEMTLTGTATGATTTSLSDTASSYPQPPASEAMGAVGALALIANAFCFALLWRHRAEDINMRSVWLCSRNDLLANALVLAAALAVWGLGSAWPDTCAGAIICALFLRSALIVAREAREELARQRAQPSLQQAQQTFLPGPG